MAHLLFWYRVRPLVLRCGAHRPFHPSAGPLRKSVWDCQWLRPSLDCGAWGSAGAEGAGVMCRPDHSPDPRVAMDLGLVMTPVVFVSWALTGPCPSQYGRLAAAVPSREGGPGGGGGQCGDPVPGCRSLRRAMLCREGLWGREGGPPAHRLYGPEVRVGPCPSPAWGLTGGRGWRGAQGRASAEQTQCLVGGPSAAPRVRGGLGPCSNPLCVLAFGTAAGLCPSEYSGSTARRCPMPDQ